jgi:hypothetical protein
MIQAVIKIRILYLQLSGGRAVGIVRSRAQTMEFFFIDCYLCMNKKYKTEV